MRILLVMPSQSGVYGNFVAPDYPHLGLAYLASVLLKAGHWVKIIDIDAGSVTEENLIMDLKKEQYGLVGITTTTPTFKNAIKLTKIIKENSNAFTVLGGIHVSIIPEESMNFDCVDFIIKGEGELTILELVRYLESGGDISLINGLYYKSNGKVIKNKDRALIDRLDDIPFPARRLFNKHNYSYPDALLKSAMPIITSRGCPAACSFCSSRSLFTRRFRARSPQNIVDEIKYLIKEFGTREIHIWDDNFVTQKERVFQIRDEIKRNNIKIKFAFPNGLRADYLNEEILRALRDMGTYSIALGVESGNQMILDIINKNLRLGQIEYIFKLAKKIGLETWAFFMIGLPNETEETIKDTINFAIKLNPDVAKFHILKPFPGTEVYKKFLDQGLLFNNDFVHFGVHTAPVHRLKTLSADQILDLQKYAYKSFYLRPIILLKQILRLKSINRLKLNIIVGKDILKNIIR